MAFCCWKVAYVAFLLLGVALYGTFGALLLAPLPAVSLQVEGLETARGQHIYGPSYEG